MASNRYRLPTSINDFLFKERNERPGILSTHSLLFFLSVMCQKYISPHRLTLPPTSITHITRRASPWMALSAHTNQHPRTLYVPWVEVEVVDTHSSWANMERIRLLLSSWTTTATLLIKTSTNLRILWFGVAPYRTAPWEISMVFQSYASSDEMRTVVFCHWMDGGWWVVLHFRGLLGNIPKCQWTALSNHWLFNAAPPRLLT